MVAMECREQGNGPFLCWPFWSSLIGGFIGRWVAAEVQGGWQALPQLMFDYKVFVIPRF